MTPKFVSLSSSRELIPPEYYQIYSIYVDMSDIWQNLLDSLTITIKQNLRFQGGICPEQFQLLSNSKWTICGHYWL